MEEHIDAGWMKRLMNFHSTNVSKTDMSYFKWRNEEKHILVSILFILNNLKYIQHELTFTTGIWHSKYIKGNIKRLD